MAIVMVIAPEKFRDEEFFEPLQVFQGKNIATQVVSTTIGQHKGVMGRVVTTTKTISQVNPDEFNAIVIVGGGGSRDYLWNNKELIELLKEFNKQGKITAAICISPAVLAQAGLLTGKKATVYPDDESIAVLQQNGAIYLDEAVIVDGKVITGRNPDAAKEFGLKIAEALGK
ncbi:DJ-1/PfpI/YhbO family deglycase/protease [Methanococcus sp. CF]